MPQGKEIRPYGAILVSSGEPSIPPDAERFSKLFKYNDHKNNIEG